MSRVSLAAVVAALLAGLLGIPSADAGRLDRSVFPQRTYDQAAEPDGGVGMVITLRSGLEVVNVLRGTPTHPAPGHAAGIKAGDRILEIDGRTTGGMNLEEAVTRIRGPVGSWLTLTLDRPGWVMPRQVTVQRAALNELSGQP